MKPIHLLLLLAALLLVGCKRNAELSEAQRASIINDVNRVMNATADSIDRKGLTGWISFFHNSSGFVWKFRDNSTSYDELVLQLKRMGPQNRSITFKWDSVQVQALSDEEASVVANYLETFVDTTGNSSQLNGLFKSTLIKVGDSWKYNKVETIPH